MSRIYTEIDSFRDLELYQTAFRLQQAIFRTSKAWPKGEAYSLTDQIRRSSRSIGANIAEAWGKRRYAAHLLSKLTDADGELQETRHWLSTAASCDYINTVDRSSFETICTDIGRMLGAMIAKHEKFCIRIRPAAPRSGPISDKP